MALDSQSDVAEDIFRAVVVLTHAYLEDFLRTTAAVFLPNADERVLDDVPLAGLGNKGRPEKFFLGKLARHKDKTIDEVIEESVSEYLGHLSFNNVTEIISFLKDLGIRLSETDWNSNVIKRTEIRTPNEDGPQGKLDQMIRRRHQIVHRADRSATGHDLNAIDGREVLDWVQTTLNFIMMVGRIALTKLPTLPT